MKSTLRTVILAVSVLLILIVPYIPHHHHNGEVCMERVLCVHDHEYNDSHTGHEAEDHHDTTSCVKHVSALRAVEDVCEDAEVIAKANVLLAALQQKVLCLEPVMASEVFVDSDNCALSGRATVVRQLRAPPVSL